MTEQQPEPVPDTAAMPPAPPPPAHETLGQHLTQWFHLGGHAAGVTAGLKDTGMLAADAQAFAHGHAAGVLHVVAEICGQAAGNPAMMALLPKALEVGAGALQLATAAL